MVDDGLEPNIEALISARQHRVIDLVLHDAIGLKDAEAIGEEIPAHSSVDASVPPVEKYQGRKRD
jgi:hypothetical protein